MDIMDVIKVTEKTTKLEKEYNRLVDARKSNEDPSKEELIAKCRWVQSLEWA